MNLEKTILREHSKANTTKIAKWVGDNPERFDALMALFLEGDPGVTQRAAWAVSECGEAHPALIKPYIRQLVARACEPDMHTAVARNVLRVLQFVDIPNKDLGRVVSLCFDTLWRSGEPVANQVNAMIVMATICEREPDLKNELRTTVEALLENGSAGLKSRGVKVLAQLEKL